MSDLEGLERFPRTDSRDVAACGPYGEGVNGFLLAITRG